MTMPEPTRVGAVSDTTNEVVMHTDETAFEGGASFLSSLTDTLKAEVRLPDRIVPLITRPGVFVRYDVNLDIQRLVAWQRLSTNKATKEVDPATLAARIISNQCTGIMQKDSTGEIITGDTVYTFRSPEIQRMMNSTDQISTVKTFFGRDATLLAHMQYILMEAGLDEESLSSLDGDSPLT